MPTLSVEDALQKADVFGMDIVHAASLLWELDNNRLQPGVDYEIDVQHSAQPDVYTVAPKRLFKFWSDAIWQRTTYLKLQRLLDKHDSRLVPEYASDEDLAFILSICQTPCIRFLRRFLIRARIIDQMDSTNFSTMLFTMWFTPHPGMKKNSTGFQHVFCGDLKTGRLSGLHNYIRVFLEEMRGNLRYMGYVAKKSPPNPGASQVLPSSTYQLMGIRFSLHGCSKPVSSMFVGVSPEFEVALYTLLFLARERSLNVKLGPYKTRVQVVQVKGKIRVAYPILLDVNHSELEDEIHVMPPVMPITGKRACAQVGGGDANEASARKRRIVSKDDRPVEIIDLNVENVKTAEEVGPTRAKSSNTNDSRTDGAKSVVENTASTESTAVDVEEDGENRASTENNVVIDLTLSEEVPTTTVCNEVHDNRSGPDKTDVEVIQLE